MHLRCHVGSILGLQLVHKSMKSTCSMQRSSHSPLHFLENYIGPVNLVLCTLIYVSIDIVVVHLGPLHFLRGHFCTNWHEDNKCTLSHTWNDKSGPLHTHETEGPWPKPSEVSHWLKKLRPFSSLEGEDLRTLLNYHGWKNSMWIHTWWNMDYVSWSAKICVMPISKR